VLDISVLPLQPQPNDWSLVFAGRNAITAIRSAPGAPWTVQAVSDQWGVDASTAVPVGYWHGKGLWAFSVPETSISQTEQIANNLYGFLGRVEESLFHAHGRAYQLLHWLDTHRYCGRCGSQTELTEGGRATLCGACSHRVYPRVSPCVIVLVSKGDQLLLAAAAGFKKRFYSTLAGFMEPGETCEQAVAREVREEVGIEVGNIRYFSSQPWPFPSQVMLGFFAEWTSGSLKLNEEEIEDADWFETNALPPTPPMDSISGQLISHFINSQ
jgi:NAD+ diphosphatase